MLRGSGTRMALWFYGMLRILYVWKALLACIHQAKFLAIKKNASVNAAIFDIENKVFFKALFALLRANFHALLVLRLCDCNEPMMDKLYYYAHLTSEALEKSREVLNDVSLFGEFDTNDASLEEEEREVFGEVVRGDKEEEPIVE